MRIVIVIVATAVLAVGIGPVMADDKADGVISGSWDNFLSDLNDDMYVQVEAEGEYSQFEAGKPRQRRRQRKHIEQLRILKMLELLDLDKDQEISFLTSYNDLRGSIRRIDEARMKLMTELGDKLHDETGSDAEIETLLGKIDANRIEKQKVETDFITLAATMLTVRQLGKLIMFNEHFERELLDRVRVFREGRMGRERPESP